MLTMTSLAHIMQLAISPVVLISGIGLLVLAMTNQFGRVIDRVRKLSADYPSLDESQKPEISLQLGILWKRATILRKALTFALLSLIFVAILIFTLFFTNLTDNLAKPSETIISIIIFFLCIISLILSLFYFIRDINLSLKALTRHLNDKT